MLMSSILGATVGFHFFLYYEPRIGGGGGDINFTSVKVNNIHHSSFLDKLLYFYRAASKKFVIVDLNTE